MDSQFFGALGLGGFPFSEVFIALCFGAFLYSLFLHPIGGASVHQNSNRFSAPKTETNFQHGLARPRKEPRLCYDPAVSYNSNENSHWCCSISPLRSQKPKRLTLNPKP